MNNSPEATAIAALVRKIIQANSEKDYDTILPLLYEGYKNSNYSDQELKEFYEDSFLGRYFGDSDIKLKKVAYIFSYYDKQTGDDFLEFEITLSNKRYDAIHFYKTSSGEWLISTQNIPYYY